VERYDALPLDIETAAETAELHAIARLSALCGAPKRRARKADPAQGALLAECQPGAMVAFDGTVYTQPELC
jgi:hypothetical protein